MNLKEILIKEEIIKIRGKQEEPFIVNELGTKSRLFIDIKEASLNPEILRRIARQLVRTIEEETDLTLINLHHPDLPLFLFDKIGSVAVGGVPIATALSLETHKPQIIVRSGKHDRGTQSLIIGNCEGKKVILIEDVSVTGNAVIKGVKAIREAGGICNTCIVVVDRQEGAERNCLDNGIILLSLLKKSDFGIDLEGEKYE